MRQSGRGGKLAFGAALALLLGSAAPATAATSIDPALAISGSVEYVTAFSVVQAGTIHASTMSAVSGGSTATSTVNGNAVTGSNPLTAALTMINDGFGVTTAASSVFNAATTGTDQYALPFDIFVTVNNTSATDTFKIAFRSTVTQSVNADGADSFAAAKLSLRDITVPATPNELFFSEVTSDTVFGDVVDGVDKGTKGEPQSADKLNLQSFTLAPGTSLALRVQLDDNGGVFENPGLSSLNATTFLAVDSVMNLTHPTPAPVPLPGAFILFGSALGGLVAFRARRAG